jgi:hypothetical protein
MKPSGSARPSDLPAASGTAGKCCKVFQDCAAATCPNDGLITLEKFLARIIQAQLQRRMRSALTLALARGVTLHSLRRPP